jgi:hypothetical protein
MAAKPMAGRSAVPRLRRPTADIDRRVTTSRANVACYGTRSSAASAWRSSQASPGSWYMRATCSPAARRVRMTAMTWRLAAAFCSRTQLGSCLTEPPAGACGEAGLLPPPRASTSLVRLAYDINARGADRPVCLGRPGGRLAGRRWVGQGFQQRPDLGIGVASMTPQGTEIGQATLLGPATHRLGRHLKELGDLRGTEVPRLG